MSIRVPGSQWRLGGLALFSGAMLYTEIGLTRLFSALYYPPVVFFILSLAVLGVGLGAGLAAWKSSMRRVRFVSIYMSAASLLTLLLLTILLHPLPGGAQSLYFVLAPFPFLFAGLALATFFSAESDRSSLLYAADLGGAGLGAMLVVPVLGWLGVPNGLVLGAAAAAAGAAPFGRGRTRLAFAIPTLIAGLLLVANITSGWLHLDMTNLPVEKPIVAKLSQGGQILRTRWDALARTDLVDPGRSLPYEIYMDGAAGSVMPPADGHESLLRDIGFFPFATEQPERVFVIGPGGGLDIWFGLKANAQAITAVEVNAASVDIVREFSTLNGDLYGNPAVRVVIDEGRSALQRESQRYDLIFLSQVVTLAAERDGYTLVENTAYTVEAFDTYLDHLRPDGQIGLKLYDEPTLTRALSTAITALMRRGMTDEEALQHTIALLDNNVDPPIPLLMVRNTPYSEDDVLSIGAVADAVGFSPLFLPGLWVEPPLDKVLSREMTWDTIVTDAGPNLTPTTDDAPFFFQFEQGVPATLRPLLAVVAIIILAGILILFLALRGPGAVTGYSLAAYFALLGCAFMLSEITLIQQTRLFLGHPTYAITVVLAVVLIGGGTGSALVGWQQRKRVDTQRIPWWPPLVVMAGLAVWLALWPTISQHTRTLELAGRLAIVLIALLPVSLFLGMPFPLGLRAAGEYGDRHVALGWAVNGVMSVAGSVFAITLAMLLGYNAVLIAASVLYGGSSLLAYAIGRND